MLAAVPIAVAPPLLDFETLYEDTFDFVYRNARRLGVPDNAADDVTQEVFLVLYRRLGEYDGRASVRSWVYGVLANTVRDYRRRFRRKSAALVSPENEDFGAALGPSNSPEQRAELHRDMSLLLSVLDELTEAERELIVLSDLEQMSVPEICACLGGNANTVYSRIRAARARLRAKLSRRLLSTSRKAGA